MASSFRGRMPVIMLLADGARVDTMARGMDAGTLPGLARLRDEGAMHVITSSFPSVTGPAYAPFLVGRYPGDVGLPGLRWYDRAREVCHFPDYTRSYVGHQLRNVDGDIDPRSPTMFELVPDSIAALSVITRGLARNKQIAGLTPRSALRAAWTHFRGDPRRWLQVDREIAAEVVRRVRDESPQYVFAAFTGVDKMSHAQGHESAGVMDALRILDDAVVELRNDLERRGAWNASRLWVSSDHGHSSVTQHEDLAGFVASLGIRVIAHPWVFTPRAQVAVMVSGNAMAHVYVDLERRSRPFAGAFSDATRELVANLIARPSVDLVIIARDEKSCDIIARAGGTATVSRSRHRYTYQRRDGDPLALGRDLHDVCAAEAHDATLASEYPDGIVQISHLAGARRSGDIILSAARHWDFRARYEPIPHVSSHGALHREHMLVPLITDATPQRVPRRTVDVMPSVLAALGISPPPGLDGDSFI